MQALQQELQALKADKAMEAGKLRIDAYRAETERLKVTGDLSIAANSQDVLDMEDEPPKAAGNGNGYAG